MGNRQTETYRQTDREIDRKTETYRQTDRGEKRIGGDRLLGGQTGRTKFRSTE